MLHVNTRTLSDNKDDDDDEDNEDDEEEEDVMSYEPAGVEA